MKQLNAEFISIGTELLLGQIANTNAQWLSEQFSWHGINTYYHTVVGDNLGRVEDAFKQAHKRSNVIVVTGGLGPTNDDMTREAFQAFSGLEMVEHELVLKKIQAHYESRSIIMTPNNRRQARVFKHADIIENDIGMAPGMIVTYDDRIWIFLPGVPHEMKHMVRESVLPYLQKQQGQSMVIQSMIIKCAGIGESRLEHELSDLIHQDNPTIAPLAETDGISLRLTVKDSSLAQANDKLEKTKEKIIQRIGDFVVGFNQETIIEKVKDLLHSHKQTISAAESLTGGQFTNQLIALEGASIVCPGGIISYDTRIKREVLLVSEATITTHGVVSKACALEMAQKIKNMMNTDIGISFTGVAGPDTLEGHQVGTVFIAIDHLDGQLVQKFVLQGDREAIRQKAVSKGFEMLFNLLKTKLHMSADR